MNQNVFLEGMPGSGKSTLLAKLERACPDARCLREGDLSPVELAWCACMEEERYLEALRRFPALAQQIAAHTMREGGRFITAYTRVCAGEEAERFYPYMEEGEIYGGRRSEECFRSIVLERFSAFTERGYVFECSFFQNLMDELLLFQLYSTQQILAFYREVIKRLDFDAFRLIRLVPRDLAASLDQARRERVSEAGEPVWFRTMLEYVRSSPYGRRHGVRDFDGLTAYFRSRQAAEDAVLALLPEGCRIDLISRDYDFERLQQWLNASAAV